ncbi:MAG: hypothetical protein ACI4U3_06500, partial [Traorella sp.]
MKKKKRRINNKIDLLLLLIFLFLGICFVIEAILGNLIPMKYIFIFLFIILVLFLGIFLTFKVRNEFFRFMRKVITILLCFVLLIGVLFQGQLRSAFSNVWGSIHTGTMYVFVRNDSKFHSM